MNPNIITAIISALVGFGTMLLSLYKGSHSVMLQDYKQIEDDNKKLRRELADLQDKYNKLWGQYNALLGQADNLHKKGEK